MYAAVVSLRPMFGLFTVGTTNNDHTNTRTTLVTGRWRLLDEHEQVQSY